jgi:hypothetical protein
MQVEGVSCKRKTEMAEEQFSGVSAAGRPCNESIRKTLEMAERMLHLADEGDAVREDVGCGILYAVLRDSAYKLKKLAEAEREVHVRKGWWQAELGR